VKYFPKPIEAPLSLLSLESNCGIMTAWMVLRYFRKRVSLKNLLEACHYSRNNGTFTIGIAYAFKKLGLNVGFYSDLDNNKDPVEVLLYNKSKRIGLDVKNAITICDLLRSINNDCISVVFFDLDNGAGHFSPLIGRRNKHIILPYTETGKMSIEKFEKKWKANGNCRQCILVSRE
jgi:hypothetical protein